ncbi:MAG: carbonic anhydrase [Gemmataceae bacterium]|nr:carbonic anhydrase [Gemmataceae bacterium]
MFSWLGRHPGPRAPGRRRRRLDVEQLEFRDVPAVSVVAVGAGAGGPPQVTVYAQATGQLLRTIPAYGPTFTGGVRVATGDLTGTGYQDVVTAPGPGGGPAVEVFDGTTGQLLRSFFAYGASFTGGVNVAVADVTGDGTDDIITGADTGGGPEVKVFDGKTGALVKDFLAYGADFRGGVREAAADLTGDGVADIITGAGPGGGPEVKVFDGKTGSLVESFFAYAPTFTGGVTVAAGDVNGDGIPDVITGAGAGGGPAVAAFSGATTTLLDSFFAYAPTFTGGVQVAGDDGVGNILTAPGPGGGADVRIFNAQSNNTLAGEILAADPTFRGGAFVGATGILGSLQGQATGPGGPLAGVTIRLFGAAGGAIQTATTDAAGNYSFDARWKAPYVVNATSPAGTTQTTPTFSTTAPTGAYAPGAGPTSWNYTSTNTNPANGPVGPAGWSTIAPEGNAPFESPINITGPTVDLSQYLTINYSPTTQATVLNNGYQIQVNKLSPADTITLAGTTYNLSNFHYHDPSENTVNGQSFPMEEHFVNVNVSASGAETVLAVFLQVGTHNAALDPILAAAQTIISANARATPVSTTTTTPIDLASLLPASMRGWFYQGSLTTPPLSQVVNWLVFSTPITLDAAQLAEYESIADQDGFLPNNRPVQPTDGRQMNSFGYDVNFQGQTVAGLNFGYTSPPVTAHAALLATPADQIATPATQSAAAPQALQPLPGCNCPLCTALRNGSLVLHQVQPSTPGPSQPAVAGGGSQ